VDGGLAPGEERTGSQCQRPGPTDEPLPRGSKADDVVLHRRTGGLSPAGPRTAPDAGRWRPRAAGVTQQRPLRLARRAVAGQSSDGPGCRGGTAGGRSPAATTPPPPPQGWRQADRPGANAVSLWSCPGQRPEARRPAEPDPEPSRPPDGPRPGRSRARRKPRSRIQANAIAATATARQRLSTSSPPVLDPGRLCWCAWHSGALWGVGAFLGRYVPRSSVQRRRRPFRKAV